MRAPRARAALLTLLAACGAHDAEPPPVAVDSTPAPTIVPALQPVDTAHYLPRVTALGWSADGARLIYLHHEEYWHGEPAWTTHECGGSGVYETDGESPPRAVLAGPEWCRWGGSGEASLAADGRTLLASPHGTPDDPCSVVRALDLQTRRWREFLRTCDAFVWRPALSPDGRTVVAKLTGCKADSASRTDADYTRHLLALDGSVIRPLGGEEEEITGAAWSPDGRRLALTRDWYDEEEAYHQELRVVDPATGRGRRIARGGGGAWSPDGRWIAYVGAPRYEQDHRFQLRVVRPDGTGDRLVYVNPDSTGWSDGICRICTWFSNGAPHSPLWSPDGRRIVFTRLYHAGETLWSIGVDGSGLRRLTTTLPPGHGQRNYHP
ncbi:MAG TPA: hypothetical protein VFQ45_08630 [Longimicrobium sp.]|nr:hypothetical protein [Longimicrobium sp.]